MARQNRGQGPQRPMKGFRPGKEPPQLRRQQVKQQYAHVDARQQRLIDMFADRTPEQARALMRRWRISLVAGAVFLAVLGAVLYGWSVIATIVCVVLAGVLLIFWWRLRQQREALESIVDAVSSPSQRKRKTR